MAKFLFWNLHRRPLQSAVAAIVKDLGIDVAILAELGVDSQSVLRALATEMPQVAFEVPRRGVRISKLHPFLRFSREFWVPVADTPRFLIARYSPPARASILVAAVHLPSQLHASKTSIDIECGHLGMAIREAESKAGTQRTIVVGDFNLDPYDHGLVSTGGLHAVMSKAVALRRTRIVGGKAFSFFYNPMWSKLGNEEEGVPGSYYYRRSEQLVYFWHVFDQVLVRPSLLREFTSSSLRFLTEIRGVSLLKGGVPDKRNYSDHLPLVFEFNLITQIGEENGNEQSLAR